MLFLFINLGCVTMAHRIGPFCSRRSNPQLDRQPGALGAGNEPCHVRSVDAILRMASFAERGVLLCEHWRDLSTDQFQVVGMGRSGIGTTLRLFAAAKLSFAFDRTILEVNFPTEGFLSIQALVAAMLEQELAARGVQSLRLSDCMEIVENLLGRLKDLEREFAARSFEQR